MEQKKDTTVKSKLGVEYTVTQGKAKELIEKHGCEWVGGKAIEKENVVETKKVEEKETPKRVRRTKEQIEADKNK